ncbi:hypothetical protein ACFLRC_01505 [Candidatus Altiarchaeota archaeon]
MSVEKLLYISALIILTIVLTSIYHNASRGWSDPYKYIKYSLYLRGEFPRDGLMQPFVYRPLTPLLAAFLPWDLWENFYIVNTVFILATEYLLYLFLRGLGFSLRESIVGVLFFLISFPTLNYLNQPLTDASGFFFLMAGIIAIWRRSDWVYVALALGAIARPSTLVLIPLVLLERRRFSQRDALFLLPLIELSLLYTYFHDIPWHFAPGKSFESPARILLVFILSFIPMLFFWTVAALNHRLWLPQIRRDGALSFLINCFLATSIIVISSIIIASFDGRFLVVYYPVAIPLTLYGLRYTLTEDILNLG